ncbi:MAG: hypothetical protein P4M11_01270 [Candidatus Pacebacteria bacterium]|nr:hypothetical protein [Candidatus Paceibacterota bacterium]
MKKNRRINHLWSLNLISVLRVRAEEEFRRRLQERELSTLEGIFRKNLRIEIEQRISQAPETEQAFYRDRISFFIKSCTKACNQIAFAYYRAEAEKQLHDLVDSKRSLSWVIKPKVEEIFQTFIRKRLYAYVQLFTVDCARTVNRVAIEGCVSIKHRSTFDKFFHGLFKPARTHHQLDPMHSSRRVEGEFRLRRERLCSTNELLTVVIHSLSLSQHHRAATIRNQLLQRRRLRRLQHQQHQKLRIVSNDST